MELKIYEVTDSHGYSRLVEALTKQGARNYASANMGVKIPSHHRLLALTKMGVEIEKTTTANEPQIDLVIAHEHG